MFIWKVDGVTMPAPEMSDYGSDDEDLDGEASGRGEAGIMKRVVIRKNVETIPMVFKGLTTAQRDALLSAVNPASIEVYINDGAERTFSAYVSKRSKKCMGWGTNGPLWIVEFKVVQN